MKKLSFKGFMVEQWVNFLFNLGFFCDASTIKVAYKQPLRQLSPAKLF